MQTAARQAEGRRHRQRHPGPRGLRAAAAANCWSSAGAPPTARSGRAVERLQAEGQTRRARPPAPPQPVPAQHRRRARQLQEVLLPSSTSASCGCSSARRTWSTPRASTRSAASRSDRRDRRGGRARSWPRSENRRWPTDRPTATRRGTATRRSRDAAAQPGERGDHQAHPQGLRLRPGSALVPRLRRLLDPGADEEGDAGPRRRRRRTSSSSPASAAPAGCRTT